MFQKYNSFVFVTKAEIAICLLISCFCMTNIASAQSNSTTGAGSTSSLQEMYAAKYGSSSQKTHPQTTDSSRYSTNSGAPPVVNQKPPMNFNQTFTNFNSRPPSDSNLSGAPVNKRMTPFNRSSVQTNNFTQTSTSSPRQLGGGDFPLPPAADEVEQFRIPQLDALIMQSAYKQNRIDGSLTPPPGYNAAQRNSRYK